MNILCRPKIDQDELTVMECYGFYRELESKEDKCLLCRNHPSVMGCFNPNSEIPGELHKNIYFYLVCDGCIDGKLSEIENKIIKNASCIREA